VPVRLGPFWREWAVVCCPIRLAVCGERDRATSVTGAWEAGGSLPFCLAPTIDVHRSAAFASMALGACDEFS
jgi:hypothetical protein